jgi:hypothetical protein
MLTSWGAPSKFTAPLSPVGKKIYPVISSRRQMQEEMDRSSAPVAAEAEALMTIGTATELDGLQPTAASWRRGG